MKKTLIQSILAAALFLLAAPVQAQTKIATVDLKKIFEGYWKTKQADANLKDRALDFDKKRKEMLDEYQKLGEDTKKLMDSANDQAVAVTEREKRKQAAEKKVLELKEIEQNIRQFDSSARASLTEQQRRMRDNVLKEIREAINLKVKAGSYTMVLDTAAESNNNTPIVLFSNGQGDLTDEILTQINANAPPEVLKALEKREKDEKSEKKEDKK
jgi:outer membrane protein